MIALDWCRYALLGLIVLQPLWFVWLGPPVHLPMLPVLIVALVPLLAVLPGVWKLRPRALVIAGCILLIYFCVAVMEAWANPPVRLPALIQIALVTIYFIALPAIRRPDRRSG